MPERPTALPPCRLISATISLLILPPSTISTTSIVASSVTRMPRTKRVGMPSRSRSFSICGPAAVNDDRIDADELEEHDVLGEALLQLVVDHRVRRRT